jgi:hypothetical protein
MSEQSLYLAAGSPTQCFNPNCKKPFEASCFRGDDNNFYCSETCAHEGFDDATIIPIEKGWTVPRFHR